MGFKSGTFVVSQFEIRIISLRQILLGTPLFPPLKEGDLGGVILISALKIGLRPMKL